MLDVDLSVPEHVLDALGQKTDYRWKAHPSGGYAAKLGGFHQMACLVRSPCPIEAPFA